MVTTVATATRYRPNTAVSAGLLLIRLILAAVFLYHGSQKVFGWFDGPGIAGTAKFFGMTHIPDPKLSAYLSGWAEFGGGIFLLLGTFMRILILPLIFNMIVAVYMTAPNGFNVGAHGCEYPLTLLVVLIGLELTGPGIFTPDQLAMRAGRETTATEAPGNPTRPV